MGVEIKGLEDIEKRLNGIADAAKMEQALNKACLVVEEAARIKADKGRTGDLARSITTKIEGFTGTIYSPLEYAPYVEYGTGLFSIHPKGGRTDVPWVYRDETTGEYIATSGQRAQPFMKPALNENIDRIVEILKGGLKND